MQVNLQIKKYGKKRQTIKLPLLQLDWQESHYKEKSRQNAHCDDKKYRFRIIKWPQAIDLTGLAGKNLTGKNLVKMHMYTVLFRANEARGS